MPKLIQCANSLEKGLCLSKPNSTLHKANLKQGNIPNVFQISDWVRIAIHPLNQNSFQYGLRSPLEDVFILPRTQFVSTNLHIRVFFC